MDCVLAAIRIMTIVFGVFYLVPGAGPAETYYYKALAAGERAGIGAKFKFEIQAPRRTHCACSSASAPSH